MTLVALATAGIVSLAPSGAAMAADATESPTPGLAMAEARVGHTATLLADGSVLIVGGLDDARVHASTEIYHPAARRFELTGSLERPRMLHSATLLPDGRVVVVGGMGPDVPARATAELYDPLDREFSSGGSLRKARAGHTATLLGDGRVLIVGGIGKGSAGGAIASAELYDPGTRQAERVGRLRKARFNHSATLLEDGSVLVVGGFAFDGDGGGKAFASAELYDPVSGRFTTVDPLAQARWQHTASRLDDGTVLVVGGMDDDGESLASVELYDPVSGRFTTVQDLTQPAVLHTSTLLDDGRVLVIGGYGGEMPSAEVYDPEARSFGDAGPLHSLRNGHRATRLEDGPVLVTGGRGDFRPVDSAELFDPTVMRVVAYGPVDPTADDAAAAPSPPPLPPLGAFLEGGRIEMPGSGFAMTFPDDWTVEVADPDPDVFGAAPGEAWEALRAYGPERLQACSVSVGVATVSLRKRSGGASDSMTVEPRWDERETGTLWAPEPRIRSGSGGVHSTMSPRDRLHDGDPDLEHDVMYVVSCSAPGDDEHGGLERALDGLTETFEFLPSED